MKRANNRKPKGSRIMDDDDKHQKRVEKVQKKLLQAHAQGPDSARKSNMNNQKPAESSLERQT